MTELEDRKRNFTFF
jgi:hypothetical protein